MGTEYRSTKCSAKRVVLILTPREVRYAGSFKQRLDNGNLTSSSCFDREYHPKVACQYPKKKSRPFSGGFLVRSISLLSDPIRALFRLVPHGLDTQSHLLRDCSADKSANGVVLPCVGLRFGHSRWAF
jgi:hypothetical protein